MSFSCVYYLVGRVGSKILLSFCPLRYICVEPEEFQCVKKKEHIEDLLVAVIRKVTFLALIVEKQESYCSSPS